MTAFSRNEVVKDLNGNHFLFLRPSTKDGFALVESVATREVFSAPLEELSSTDRESF